MVNVNAGWRGATWSLKRWGLSVTLLNKNQILSLSWFKCYKGLPSLFGMKIKILNMELSPSMILPTFLGGLTLFWSSLRSLAFVWSYEPTTCFMLQGFAWDVLLPALGLISIHLSLRNQRKSDLLKKASSASSLSTQSYSTLLFLCNISPQMQLNKSFYK